MINLIAIVISIHIFSAVNNEIPLLFAQVKVESVNVHAIIMDSLTNESIPSVRVTIENLGKSFRTTRSSFYVLLTTETYTFLLEAEGYEELRKSIPLSSQNNKISFEMVKVSDRMVFKA
ncbi:unnamed protein product, partial [marine sediment metagenome]